MIRFPNLAAGDIEVRVQQVTENGCSLLLYKDARCDMRVLDETVGNENWDCEYKSIDGKMFCTVGILCQTASGNMTWVYKQDVGVESNMEPTKGEASDAFKRACFKWGIGRELYTAPFIWVESGLLQKYAKDNRSGRWVCRDRFRVNTITVNDGKITDLVIENTQGLTVYQMGRKVSTAKKPHTNTPKGETAPQNANKSRYARIYELKDEAAKLGIGEAGIKSWLDANYGKPMQDFTAVEIKQTELYIANLIADKRKLDGC